MPKYLDSMGVALLWSKIKKLQSNNLVYQTKTTAQWNSNPSYPSKKGTLYIYSDYQTVEKDGEEIYLPGVKLGTGNAYLIDLPFLNTPQNNEQFLDHINDTTRHITAAERQFWNNKINIDLNLHDENLIINRN